MCKSVPQIEAVFTRTSTSVGPTKGTATVSICKPLEARIFRNAFIVPAILASYLCRARLLRRAPLLSYWPVLDRSALPRFRDSALTQPLNSPTQFPMLAHRFIARPSSQFLAPAACSRGTGNGRPVVHCAYGSQKEDQKEADEENCTQEGEANEEGRPEKSASENESRHQENCRRKSFARG